MRTKLMVAVEGADLVKVEGGLGGLFTPFLPRVFEQTIQKNIARVTVNHNDLSGSTGATLAVSVQQSNS